MKIEATSHGYYYVSIGSFNGRKLMKTNNERAYVISQLQDLLSPRLLIESAPRYVQLPSCIDLLAFSITGNSIALVAFTIDESVITLLASSISSRLLQYQDEYRSSEKNTHQEPHVVIKKLLGPHQALAHSIELHLLHDDWEYDRYSSIGFYLHDRRGDWMRTWRLAALYDNEVSNYRLLLEAKPKSTPHFQPTLPTYAS